MIFFQIPSKVDGELLCADQFRLRMKFGAEFRVEPYIGTSLHRYLSMSKDEITNHTAKWDKYKKYTNVHEFVHTAVPDSRYSVCKLRPVSRSFYKMIEIARCFHLIKEIAEKKRAEAEGLRTFHIAEGPGGFIEAIQHMRKDMRVYDVYYGMTLNSPNANTPGWKKSYHVLNRGDAGNFHIVNGADNTGDVTKSANFRYCIEHHARAFDLVTADGGFDFTTDFNKQEVSALRLIISEVFTALAVQKPGGYLVLKIYDVFMKTTVEIIYLLCSMYESVFMCKPNMSRTANSEKYIVCKGLLRTPDDEILAKFGEIIEKMEASPDYVVESILNVEIDHLFYTKMNEVCSVIGQQQLENISSTLGLILNPRADKLEAMKRSNTQTCIAWCVKHDLPHHNEEAFANYHEVVDV